MFESFSFRLKHKRNNIDSQDYFIIWQASNDRNSNPYRRWQPGSLVCFVCSLVVCVVHNAVTDIIKEMSDRS